MDLVTQGWGPVVIGLSTFLIGWMVVRKGRPKPAAKAQAKHAAKAQAKPAAKPKPGEEAHRKRSASAAALVTAKPAGPSPKAIVWQVPQGDEDITVLRAIPVFDRPADAAEAPKPKLLDAEEEEARSQIELIYEADAETEEVTASSARILLYAAGDSDRGRVRQRNEDSMLLMPERSLFAVADGMGGHRGGEVASRLAIETLEDAFHRSAFEGKVHAEGDVPRRARELAAAVQMTNECVHSMALADRELSGMGTTLVAARFSPNKQRLYVGHVGDSRCYRLRQGKLRQLTTDHTLASLGMNGPRSNDLYQAVGVNPGLSIDLIVDKPHDDDVYLLCTDGLSKMVSDDRIRDVLVEHEDLESALYTLIEEVNDRGATDNVTAIIIKVLSRTSKKAMESLTSQV